MASKVKPVRDSRKELIGWLSITLIILLFPTLFFLCVYFPIWMGWAARFP